MGFYAQCSNSVCSKQRSYSVCCYVLRRKIDRIDMCDKLPARRSMTGQRAFVRATLKQNSQPEALRSAWGRQCKQLKRSTRTEPKLKLRRTTNSGLERPKASNEPPRTKPSGMLTHPH